jgi:spleen tyrosine kinase
LDHAFYPAEKIFITRPSFLLNFRKLFRLKMNDKEQIAIYLPDQYVQDYLLETNFQLVDKRNITKELYLAHGSYGIVSNATIKIKDLNLKFAIKQAIRKEFEEELWKEAHKYNELKHPNIIFCVGTYVYDEKLMIILEFAPYGRMDDYLLDNRDSLGIDKIVNFCFQIASAMTYIHELGDIVHRDLAARNILVFNENLCKLIDFGMSRTFNRNLTKCYYAVSRNDPNFRWTPPDAIKTRIYDEKSDVWSFGVMCWEATSYGQLPYGSMEDYEIADFLDNGERLGKLITIPK